MSTNTDGFNLFEDFDLFADMEIDEPEKIPTLHECIKFLADRCDGARTIDGQGFNKLDTFRGLRLAQTPPDKWSDWDRMWAFKRVRKYHGQLEQGDIAWEKVPEPQFDASPFREIRIDEDGEHFIIAWGHMERDDFVAVRAAANKIPGIWWIYRKQERASVPFDSVAARALRDFAKDWQFDYEKDVEEKLFELIDRSALLYEWAQAVTAPDYDLGPAEITAVDGKSAWPHQRSGVRYLEAVKWRAIIGDEMGSGKSATALLAAVKANAFPLLIVCPASVKYGWEAQIKNWLPEKTVAVLSGGGLQSIKADVLIANYDILRNKNGTPNALFSLIIAKASEGLIRGVIADECHMLKSTHSGRTQAMKQLYKSAEKGIFFRLHMSGTPIMNRVSEFIPNLELTGLLDHFGGIHQFMRLYNVKYANLTQMFQKLCEAGYLIRMKEDHVIDPDGKLLPLKAVPSDVANEQFFEWYKAQPKTPEVIDYVTTELRKRDYIFKPGAMELPPKTIQMVPMDMQDPARYGWAHSRALEYLQELVDQYGDPGAWQRWQRALWLVHLIKLRGEQGRQKFESVRKWAEEFMESTDEKLILVVWHKPMVEMFTRYFKGAACIAGGQSMKERDDNRKRFAHDPNCKLMVMQILSGGQGIDELQFQCSNIAFAELGWNPAQHKQAEDRLHRGGQTRNVTVSYLIAKPVKDVAPKTLDGYLTQIVDQKKEYITPALHGGSVPDEDQIGSLTSMLFDDI